MILRLVWFLPLLSFTLVTISCKDVPSENEILKIQKEISLELPAALTKILPLVFPHLLKDWKLELDPKSNQWILKVSYGGNTALTFDSQKEYIENIKHTQALYNARLAAAIRELPIQEIQLSLTKPLYVKGENHPDVGIQEFEIFRTSLDLKQTKVILDDLNGITPFSSYRDHKEKLVQLFDKIEKIWTIELNQLNQITVE